MTPQGSPGPNVIGQWEGPWDYHPGVWPSHPHNREFAHADLIAKGPNAGQVLLWRVTVDLTDPLWIFDPLSPQNLRVIGGPTTSNVCQLTYSTNIFCSGHAKMEDGTLLISSGTALLPPAGGFASSFRFDPVTLTFTPAGCMNRERWYPTVVRRGENEAIAIGGWKCLPDDQTDQGCDEPNPYHRNYEVYDPALAPAPTWVLGTPDLDEMYSTWTQWSCNLMTFDAAPFGLYPRTHLLTNGWYYVSGDLQCCTLIDPSDTSNVDYSFGNDMLSNRGEGCAVRLPGFAGGTDEVVAFDGTPDWVSGNSALNTIEVNPDPAAPAAWAYVNNDPSFALLRKRVVPNAVILPNKTVFIVGGSSRTYGAGLPWYAGIPEDPENPGQPVPVDEYPQPVRVPELLYRTSPTGPWAVQELAEHKFAFLYHAVAVLLPSGKVFVGGGEQVDWTALAAGDPALSGETSADAAIYSPPYLFQGPRPQIVSVLTPQPLQYGPLNPFQMQYQLGSASDPIAKVVLIRPGSVTHHFDFEQRYVELTSQPAGPGVLQVTPPPNENTAQTGYWMLFLVSQAGIPSEAKFVQFLL